MIRTFSPDRQAGDVGIVLLNHAGSSVAQDTGRDARYLADTFALPVIAADRPGSTFGWKGGVLTPDTVDQKVEDLVLQVDEQARRLGVTTLIAAGRSAGGLGTLLFAKANARTSDAIPVEYAYAAEPVGWYATTPTVGKQDWLAYLRRQRARQLDRQGNPDLILPEHTELGLMPTISRLGAMIVNNIVDQRNNKLVWSTPIALRTAEYIARHLPDMHVQIDFAEDSMMANQQAIDAVTQELPALRTPGDRPFTVEQPAHTTHASFDRRSFFAERLRPLVHVALHDQIARIDSIPA